MAFRTGPSLSSQYERAKAYIRNLKPTIAARRDNLASGPTSVFHITTELLPLLVEAVTRLSAPSSGLAQYAQEQEADPAYDVVAEYQALRAAAIDARDWIIANTPTSDGFIAERSINPDGTFAERTVTVAQTADLRTKLQVIIDAID